VGVSSGARGTNGSIAESSSRIVWKRSPGSFISARVTIAASAGGTPATWRDSGVSSSRVTARPTLSGSLPENGGTAASISYRITPSDQMSLRASADFALRNASGDM
jgi:hypothetical protein